MHGKKFAAALQAADAGDNPDPHPDRDQGGSRGREAHIETDRRGGGHLRLPLPGLRNEPDGEVTSPNQGGSEAVGASKRKPPSRRRGLFYRSPGRYIPTYLAIPCRKKGDPFVKTQILFAIVLALALTACGDDDSPQAVAQDDRRREGVSQSLVRAPGRSPERGGRNEPALCRRAGRADPRFPKRSGGGIGVRLTRHTGPRERRRERGRSPRACVSSGIRDQRIFLRLLLRERSAAVASVSVLGVFARPERGGPRKRVDSSRGRPALLEPQRRADLVRSRRVPLRRARRRGLRRGPAGERSKPVDASGKDPSYRCRSSAVRDPARQSLRGKHAGLSRGDLCVRFAKSVAIQLRSSDGPFVGGGRRAERVRRNRYNRGGEELRLEHHGREPLLQRRRLRDGGARRSPSGNTRTARDSRSPAVSSTAARRSPSSPEGTSTRISYRERYGRSGTTDRRRP